MPPDVPRLHEVQTDIYIARRRRLHAVNDPTGVPVFHGPRIIEVLDWLADNDVNRVRFTDDALAFEVTFERCTLEQPSDRSSENG
ncbi:MAG TPA: hypothetical protein ENH80_09175 [Phycisphaerae bacterium]|nr:hypothetical protein [Phycisphaerae bacterium]